MTTMPQNIVLGRVHSEEARWGENRMVAEAVRRVNPLVRLTVARQGPDGSRRPGMKVTVSAWPGARVMIWWIGNGPALLPPGP